MPSFRTTILDLLVSVAFEPDCLISSVLPEASENVRAHLSGSATRVTSINGHLVTDRIQLRDLLVNMNPDENVCVEFTQGPSPKTDMSVSCNGVTSTLRQEIQPESDDGFGSLREDCRPDDDDADDQHHHHDDDDAADLEAAPSFSPKVQITAPADDDSRGVSPANPPTSDFEASGVQLASFSIMGQSASTLMSSPAQSSKSPVGMSLSIKTRIEHAAHEVGKAGIIVCVCADVNPIGEIELLCKKQAIQMTLMDLGIKLRLRSATEFAKSFAACLKTGGWFVVTRGTKSIATLRLLEGLVKEIRENDLKEVHNNARIIICSDSHPHFPRGLLVGSQMLRITQNFGNSNLMHASVISAASTSRTILAQSITDTTADLPREGRKVRMSAAVEIVDIEPRDATQAKVKKNNPIDVSGSVSLRFVFDGLNDDKFLAVTTSGIRERFAVSSSLGNVYFFDDSGASLMQVHAHDASIWDLSFASSNRFVTGCEDGHCSEWLVADEDATLVTRYDVGGDVYAVKYLREGDEASPLITGGLPKHLFVKSATGTTSYIALSGNCQVISTFPERSMCAVGGGDGVVTIADVNTQSIFLTCSEHTRKTPSLTVLDSNTFFSGSFDSTIKAWDVRETRARATHTLKLQSFVTGLHVDGFTLAACVGENLYLWDVRALHQVLGGVPSGWKGLSRAVRVCSSTRTIVSASPDGHVRFWSYV
jgi:WD40 repeat protein